MRPAGLAAPGLGRAREGKVCQGFPALARWPRFSAQLLWPFPWLPAAQRTLADPRGGAAGSRRFAKAQVQAAEPWSLSREIRQTLSPAGTLCPLGVSPVSFKIHKGLFLSNTSLGLKVSPAGESLQSDRHPKTPPTCPGALSHHAVSLFNHYLKCTSLFIYLLTVSTRLSTSCVAGAAGKGGKGLPDAIQDSLLGLR